jgi:hypothetical protein
MRVSRLGCLLALTVVVGSGSEAHVRLLVIGGFGQERPGCEVASFRNMDEPLGDGGYRDYRRLFQGLEARQVPYARYEVSVRCADQGRGTKDVQVDLPDDFEVVSTSERMFRTHDLKPSLKVLLRARPKANEVWWIRLIGIYGGSDLSARFSPTTLETTVFDPQPGRYLVFINSSKGFSCFKRIDVFDAPKQWSVDPSGCSFELDGQAKLVLTP